MLDVGCGANSPIGRFRRRPEYAVGVDAFRPALEASRSAGLHAEYVELDVRRIGEMFEPRSFDAVVAFDLLEHLDYSDASRLLLAMEQLAARRVVVLTPSGFLPQHASADGNELQIHRSGWSPHDFTQRGYEVCGLNGLRWLRGEKGSPRWRPARFWGAVSNLTQPLAHRLPGLAFHLLAVKQTDPHSAA